MDVKTQARIDEISQRLDEYFKHLNDPYAYDIDEINAIRNFKGHAPEDIRFLLSLMSLKSPGVKIEVKCESETGTSHDPARVRVYKNNELVAEVKAELRLGTGADGGSYYCIILKRVEIEKDEPKKVEVDTSTPGTSGYFTVSDNPDSDQLKTFYDPHPVFAGAAKPIPIAVKRVADELAGEKMPLSVKPRP